MLQQTSYQIALQLTDKIHRAQITSTTDTPTHKEKKIERTNEKNSKT